MESKHGTISVYIIGDRKLSPIVTYHDLGLNGNLKNRSYFLFIHIIKAPFKFSANSCFQSFFQFSEMSVIGDRFCIYHINAPGQEEDAESFLEK